MQATELTIFLTGLGLFVYWLGSIKAKENATRYAAMHCRKLGLGFLDDTVELKKVRLRRTSAGSLNFYREYRFEFTSTGERRYKGLVSLLGKRLIGFEMEPYKIEEPGELPGPM